MQNNNTQTVFLFAKSIWKINHFLISIVGYFYLLMCSSHRQTSLRPINSRETVIYNILCTQSINLDVLKYLSVAKYMENLVLLPKVCGKVFVMEGNTSPVQKINYHRSKLQPVLKYLSPVRKWSRHCIFHWLLMIVILGSAYYSDTSVLSD